MIKIIKRICPSTDSSGLTLCSTTCLFCVVILPPFLINLFCVNLVYFIDIRLVSEVQIN